MRWSRVAIIVLAASSLTTAVVGLAPSAPAAAALTIDIIGPAGSQSFGQRVYVLTNGNIVVTDRDFNIGGAGSAGAVHLYDGTTRQLISTLRGSKFQDHVGDFVVDLHNGNFVVVSQDWDNGALADAGAVTFVNGTVGLNGVVSAANSLVGSHAQDRVGSVHRLTNGNFVVSALSWDNGAIPNAGFVRLVNGVTGAVGALSSANALVGLTADDLLGFGGADVVELTNGNVVVSSPYWSNGTLDVGAVTWMSGATGLTGAVSIFNSTYGTTANDHVGLRVKALTNGNYVIGSPDWNNAATNDVGAATWRSGAAASAVAVGTGNSMYGSTAEDALGVGVVALTNGNYVVSAPDADLAGPVDNGAAIWGNGTAGTVGTLSSLPRLRGSANGDGVGSAVPLTNGNYIVSSPGWDNGPVANAGAATWQSGTTPVTATVSTANSLVGSHVNDFVGGFPVALSDGNVAIASSNWKGIASNGGAVTWISGTGPTAAIVSTTNSIVGSSTDDFVGQQLNALGNGDYLVSMWAWDAPGAPDAGMAMHVRGGAPANTPINASTALIGAAQDDNVASSVNQSPNGLIVMTSASVDRGAVVDAGAATWIDDSTVLKGTVSPANSLMGTRTKDGSGFAMIFDDGYSAFINFSFDAGDVIDAGAVVLAGPGGLTGDYTADNSSFGTLVGGATTWTPAERRLPAGGVVVGKPAENRVSIVEPTDFVPVSPARLADTRAGAKTVDGANAGTGRVTQGSTLELVVAGRGGVAATARAVALNVTAVDGGADGFVTVFPCGSPRPTASNLNFASAGVVPNAVIVKVGDGGRVCLFVSQATDLVVDVNGWFPDLSRYHALNPARVLETRAGLTTADGQQQGGGPNAGGSVLELQVAGRVGVPGGTGASAVALNVTALGAALAGFVTVFPCGSGRPTASSLNVAPGAVVANLVVASLGVGGKVCIFTQTTMELVVDVNGWFPTGSSFTSLVPARLLETRSGLSTIDGEANGLGLRDKGGVTVLQVTGRGGVPAGAATVVLNVTAIDPQAGAFVTVYPCGIEPPLASNVNVVPGQTVPNAVIVRLGGGGLVCLFTSQQMHLVVDVVGHLPV